MNLEDESGSGRRGWAAQLLPPLFFTLLTAAATCPLVFHLQRKSMPGGSDKYIFLWDLSWVGRALTDGRPLYHTDLVFHPAGTSLAFHTLCPANGLLGLLLGSPANLLLAHNLLFLLSFVLGGWFTFLLVRGMSGSPAAGLLAGVVFAFAHPGWRYVFQGQMNLICRQWIPLLLLLVFTLLRRPRRRTGLWIGLAAALVIHTSLQQAVFAALLLVPLALHGLAGRGPAGPAEVRKILSGLLIAAAVAGLLSAPLLAEMARSAGDNRISADPDQAARSSTALEHVLFGRATGPRVWNRLPAEGLPGLAAGVLERIVPRRGPLFGYAATAVLIAGFGCALARRRRRGPLLIWAAAATLLVLLMTGPRPRPFGHPVPSLYLALSGLPGLGALRFPSRYAIPLTLAAAVLAGLSWAALEKRFLAGRRPALRIAAAALAVLLPFAEYYRAPFRLVDLHRPPAVYHELARAGEGALLELPFWASGAYFIIGRPRYETTWFQTVHQRPRPGGHVSRAGGGMAALLRGNRALAYLSDPDRLARPAPVPPAFARLRDECGVRYVNVDRSCYRPEQEERLRRLLERRLGAVLIAGEPRYLTYRIGGSPGRGR